MRWLMMILIFAIFDWFPRRKPCAGVSHDGAETSPNEDLFLGCYLLADGISAAARKCPAAAINVINF
jgi:hypothetical protein